MSMQTLKLVFKWGGFPMGIVMNAVGAISSFREASSWGLPPPVWQYLGFALFAASGLAVIFGLQKENRRLLGCLAESAKQSEAKNKPDLIIGAKVNSISTYDYYAKAFGHGDEGDRRVILEIVLSPTRPIMLDYLALELWGEKFEIETLDRSDFAEGLFPMLYQDVSRIEGCADIPKKSAINTKDAKVYALANGAEYLSEPFSNQF